nr:MAG TPA: hypothetical protein [Microviridae sp.]
MRQENRVELQEISKLRGFKIQGESRIVILESTIRSILAKGNQITSVNKRVI